jgi:hypothetical protein
MLAVAATPELIAMYVVLATALVAGGAVIFWAARRYKRPKDETLTPAEELARYRAMKDTGELAPEEFERLRALLDPASAQAPTRSAERGGPPDALAPGPPPP